MTKVFILLYFFVLFFAIIMVYILTNLAILVFN